MMSRMSGRVEGDAMKGKKGILKHTPEKKKNIEPVIDGGEVSTIGA